MKQRGFALVTVIVLMFLIASVAMMLGQSAATNASNSSAELRTANAEKLAQGAMQHALWRHQHLACGQDPSIATTTLGDGAYEVTASGDFTVTTTNVAVDQDAYIKGDQTSNVNGDKNSSHIRGDVGKEEQALYRFDLSSFAAGTQVQSAIAWFRLKSSKDHPEAGISVHRVTKNWNEANATWDLLSDGIEAKSVAVIPAQETKEDWVSVNLSGLVQAWVNGQPNHGIVMKALSEATHTEYDTRESGADAPYLVVITSGAPLAPTTLQATATLNDGTTRTVQRADLRQLHSPTEWQLSTADSEAQDTTISQSQTNWNAGARTTMDVVDTSGGSGYHSLLQFDVAQLPPDARAISATLSLYQSDASTPGGTLRIERLTRTWDEGSETGGTGAGATWSNAQTGQAWTNAGGDTAPAAYASATFAASSAATYDIDVTHVVNEWLTGQSANHGFLLLPDSAGTDLAFSTSDDSDTERHPRLTINYACACGSPCLRPQGSGDIALVTNNPFSPPAEDQYKRQLFESWGYNVRYIDDSTLSIFIDLAISGQDVAYISETVTAESIGTKLKGKDIGIVVEEGRVNDELGIASGRTESVGKSIAIQDVSHYITQPFTNGSVDLYGAYMQRQAASGTTASGATVLTTTDGADSLVVLDRGASLQGGGTAAARRVSLPLGDHDEINLEYVASNGWLLTQRAIEWAKDADDAASGTPLLMVVGNDNNLTTDEQKHFDQIESFGFAITVIDEDDSQSEFDTALASVNVVYVSKFVNSGDVSSKLTDATVGVVTDEPFLLDELQFSSASGSTSSSNLDIDNSHFITSLLLGGDTAVLDSAESLYSTDGTTASGASVLATSGGEPAIVYLETAATGHDSNPTSGRRVFLPWGNGSADPDNMNADALTIFRRALEWAAGLDYDPPPNVIVATDSAATIGGVTFTDRDLLRYNIDGDNAAVFFDGVTAALTQGLDAFHWLEDGRYVMSSAGTIIFGGGTFEDEDLFIYDPIADTASILVDGSNAFTGTSGNISAVFVDENGLLHLANDTATTLAGVSFEPGDILQYDSIAGTASLFFDGSSVGLTAAIDAFHVLESGNYVLSVDVAAVLGGLNINPGDLVEYDPVADSATLLLDGALFTETENVRAAHIGVASGIAPEIKALAHWKFDEGSGTFAEDSAGDHDGSLINSPAWVTGQLDDALNFGTSTAAEVRVPHDSELSLTDEMTFMAWVRYVYRSGYQTIIEKDNGGSNTNYFFSTWSDEVELGYFYNGGYYYAYTPNVNLQNGQWYHLAVSFDDTSNAVRFYVDGVQQHVGSLTVPMTPVSTDLRIGVSVYGDSNYGTLDDVRIYDRVLDAQQIQAIATGGSPGGGGGGGSGGGSCSETFRDEFNTISYSNNDGTLNWSTDWLEINESNGPFSGDEVVGNRWGPYHARIRDNDGGGEGLQREADLSAYTSATLSFLYIRDRFDNSNDYVTIDVSSNGGASWTELDRFSGPATDSNYVSTSYDISSYISDETRIRFLSSPNLGGADSFYPDDVQIAVSGCADP